MLFDIFLPKNQTRNIDTEIDPIFNHFVHVPKKSTANPPDIPFFLSTRIVQDSDDEEVEKDGFGSLKKTKTNVNNGDPCSIEHEPTLLSKLVCSRDLMIHEHQQQMMLGKDGQNTINPMIHLQRIEEISSTVVEDYESHMERFG